MKKLLVALKVLAGCLLVLGILLVCDYWGAKRPVDYKIDDICMERIILDNSICHGHQHYLVHFGTSPVHYEYGWFVMGTRPHTDGCADSILDISIESKSHKRLDDYILAAEPLYNYTKEELCLSMDSICSEKHSHGALQRIKVILQEGRDEKGFISPCDYFISLDSLSPIPQYVTIKFPDREIRRELKTTTP